MLGRRQFPCGVTVRDHCSCQVTCVHVNGEDCPCISQIACLNYQHCTLRLLISGSNRQAGTRLPPMTALHCQSVCPVLFGMHESQSLPTVGAPTVATHEQSMNGLVF
eukprot:TRINITY_DN6748_c0_g1_i1.p2 TRINITY_DN6748_c0_g1~~TRINITY_DN6748_c0_g1_i1.p2  ORF type:complete len:107 (-),score=1.70 TRINITY_DN6748_c0_g1_i1:416-736(-)